MPDIPLEAVKAAAETLHRQFSPLIPGALETLTWEHYAAEAREVLEAAAPAMAGHAAAKTAEDGSRLPSGAQIRAWLTTRGWTLRGTGPGGTLWEPPGGGAHVGVLHDDGDEWFTGGTLSRIAARAGCPVDEMRREMLADGTREDDGRG